MGVAANAGAVSFSNDDSDDNWQPTELGPVPINDVCEMTDSGYKSIIPNEPNRFSLANPLSWCYGAIDYVSPTKVQVQGTFLEKPGCDDLRFLVMYENNDGRVHKKCLVEFEDRNADLNKNTIQEVERDPHMNCLTLYYGATNFPKIFRISCADERSSSLDAFILESLDLVNRGKRCKYTSMGSLKNYYKHKRDQKNYYTSMGSLKNYYTSMGSLKNYAEDLRKPVTAPTNSVRT